MNLDIDQEPEFFMKQLNSIINSRQQNLDMIIKFVKGIYHLLNKFTINIQELIDQYILKNPSISKQHLIQLFILQSQQLTSNLHQNCHNFNNDVMQPLELLKNSQFQLLTVILYKQNCKQRMRYQIQILKSNYTEMNRYKNEYHLGSKQAQSKYQNQVLIVNQRFIQIQQIFRQCIRQMQSFFLIQNNIVIKSIENFRKIYNLQSYEITKNKELKLIEQVLKNIKSKGINIHFIKQPIIQQFISAGEFRIKSQYNQQFKGKIALFIQSYFNFKSYDEMGQIVKQIILNKNLGQFFIEYFSKSLEYKKQNLILKDKPFNQIKAVIEAIIQSGYIWTNPSMLQNLIKMSKNIVAQNKFMLLVFQNYSKQITNIKMWERMFEYYLKKQIEKNSNKDSYLVGGYKTLKNFVWNNSQKEQYQIASLKQICLLLKILFSNFEAITKILRQIAQKKKIKNSKVVIIIKQNLISLIVQKKLNNKNLIHKRNLKFLTKQPKFFLFKKLIKFVDNESFYNLLLLKKQWSFQFIHQKIKLILINNNNNQEQRKILWAKILIKNKYSDYNQLNIQQIDYNIKLAIQQDVFRSYHPFQINPKHLINILCALAIKIDQIKYLQGMNFIAAYILKMFQDEQKSYLIIKSIIENKYQGILNSDQMYKIKQKMSVYQNLLYIFQPQIYLHFRIQGIISQYYMISWIITLFTHVYSQPQNQNVLNIIWDMFIISGWKMFYRFLIWILGQHKQQILLKDYESLLNYLSQLPKKVLLKYQDQPNFKNYITKIKITNTMINIIEQNYKK